MDQDRWAKVQSIFNEALNRKPEERKAFLDEACGTDADLRAEVESLLAHERAATAGFMQPPGDAAATGRDDGEDPATAGAPAADATAPTLPSPARSLDPLLGRTIGHYRLLETLGEGGFGVVYLAEQIEPIRRRVAVKVIKLGMDSMQVIARFEAERQALALMDHPNVAQVHEAGTTDDGRPYFVMEYVHGVPVTEHCDLHRLTIDERLSLFVQICEAVQHAHQKGIIHRDLKPSNILVTVKDGQAVPKVIDFGVAKALHQKLTERTLFTEHGQLIGTPVYMSPEQTKMTAQDIDTRSDIYSLGVLLYELLTGALPFDPSTLRQAAISEIQRIIREEDPAKPSTRLSSLGNEHAASARRRRVDPKSLVRELRGDLDWITMKALEKDRARRYESASGLAMDIRRHLGHEPVLAGPPSAVYRARKFVRRHRPLALGVAAIFLVLVGGIVATSLALARALRAEQQAETRFDQVREVANSLIFDVNDRLEDLPGSLGARQFIVATALRYLDQLTADAADDPRLMLGLDAAWSRLGNIQGGDNISLGDEEGALASFQRGLELAERLASLHADDADFRARHAGRLSDVGTAYLWLGDVETARDYFTRAIEIQEALVAAHPDDPWFQQYVSESQSRIGLSYMVSGDLRTAVKWLRRSLEIRQRLAEARPDDKATLERLASVQLTLGAAFIFSGEPDEARPLLESAQRIYRGFLAQNPKSISAQDGLVKVCIQLAQMHLFAGAIEPALEASKEAIEYAEAFARSNPLDARARYNLGSVNVVFGATLVQRGFDASQPAEERVEVLQRARTFLREGLDTLRALEDEGIMRQAESLAGVAAMRLTQCEEMIERLQAQLAAEPEQGDAP